MDLFSLFDLGLTKFHHSSFLANTAIGVSLNAYQEFWAPSLILGSYRNPTDSRCFTNQKSEDRLKGSLLVCYS